ncbi:MAG: tetratricopeptide repeat protein [Vicinamibacterales bacterium]
MSDPLRTDLSRVHARSESDRTAKIEQLLLDGLDQYFSGQYEQAINVWTRALFLDRSHPRARAYIDRARAALAEQQRQSEELLHSGVAAFDRGESREARRLLEDALQRGAPPEEALSVLGRLDRIEPRTSQAARHAAPASNQQQSPAAAPEPPARNRSRGWIGAIAATLTIAAAGWLVAVAGMESVLPFSETPAELLSSPAVDQRPLPVPLRGAIALERARTLASTGRLHDALAVLQTVRVTDPEKGAADRLTGDIQRQLIEFSPSVPPAPGAGGPRP